MDAGGKAEDYLILRPFPQHHAHDSDSSDSNLSRLWTRYRKDMIAHAGIALFFFGNKSYKDDICLSNGMREEFDLAKENGLFLLPIGATGYMAKELWNEVRNSFDEYDGPHKKELREKFELLGTNCTDLNSIHKNIMAILSLLRE